MPFNITTLLIRSSKIQQHIEDELRRARPDRMRLLKLKTIKLTIAEKMQKLVYGQDMHAYRLAPVPVRKRPYR